MKAMRGIVGFDYDLRKTLNRGQKAAIRRNYQEFVGYKNQRFIKPPKHKGETKRAYQSRLKELQGNVGQAGNNWNGFFINMPKDARYRIRGDRIHWTGENKSGRKVSETFVPMRGAEIADDPAQFAQDIWERFAPFRRVFFNHNGYRSRRVIEDLDVQDEESFAEVMEAVFNEFEGTYANGKDAINSITGLIIQY